MSRSSRTTSSRALTAREQQARAQAQAHTRCQRGEHQTMPTFRPGERVCLICGVVFYCSACLSEHHLQVAQAAHVYHLACSKHQHVEVRQP
jgi:hypothetical protein